MEDQRPIQQRDQEQQTTRVVTEQSGLRYTLQKQNLLLVAFLIVGILTVTGACFAVVYAVVEHFSLTYADASEEHPMATSLKGRALHIAMQKVSDEDLGKMVFCFVKPKPMSTSPHAFRIENVSTALCDAIVYTSVGIDSSGTKIRSRNLDVDIGAQGFKRFVALKKRPGSQRLTTWICVGSEESDNDQFRAMVSRRRTRLSFIHNAVAWMKEQRFDGVAVYWRYPNAEAKSNFSTLINTLQYFCHKENLRMTVVLPWNFANRRQGYFVRSIYDHTSYVIVDSQKTVNPRDFPVTTCQSPMRCTFRARRHGQLGLTAILDDLSMETDHLLKRTVLSISLGGIAFTVKRSGLHRMGMTSVGAGRTLGLKNNRLGIVSYYDIKETLLKNASWTEYFHRSARCAIAYNQDQWIGFENHESIQAKRPLVRRTSGMAVWDLEMDDFAGGLGPAWPLLTAAHDVVHGQQNYDLVTLTIPLSRK
ncbi:endochitinase-like [Ornithodoros turicata]|uniref:endochitinase-like n=1 Tax=Ornithodoros turicata TaxID=34597 RepID=UPI00313A2E2C